ncbi:distal tail protein Dit [Anaerococcus vaginalis]|uniref:distal tail protein Dit n=1 Tax=Anaerococcus vaginalis TaxID=33037 RepID=UPI002912DD9D|nr:distal tail protein Dit [Anaerococcus vaginalis]MDU5252705.1 phage tail family protein [Anaerococcus vaginalis]MDU6781462.1 phage tail family protein [Anaerococcus vaginalis]
MVYKFIDTNEANLKSYASIQTIINGFNLDTELDGYRTLNVSGRSVFGRDIETLKFSARRNAGSKSTKSNSNKAGNNKFFSSDIQSVVIEVEFLLEAPTNELFRELLSKFITILHQEEAKWTWTDDPNFYYTGTISEIGDFKEDKNSVISTFKILCVDPMKTSIETYVLKGNGKEIEMPDFKEEIDILEMKFVLNSDSNKFTFENMNGNGKTIFSYLFKSNNRINILLEEQKCLLNGRNLMPAMDLMSDFEDFFVNPKDTILLSSACDYEIKYKLRSY